MKQLVFLVAVISLAMPSFSCKSKKEATTSSSTETPAADKKAETFRLVISFISKGAGTDREKGPAIIAYVDNHAKKPKYTAVHWGREGETDYCFKLTELTKDEQKSFIDEIKKIANGSDMIHISENAECQHKGR